MESFERWKISSNKMENRWECNFFSRFMKIFRRFFISKLCQMWFLCILMLSSVRWIKSQCQIDIKFPPANGIKTDRVTICSRAVFYNNSKKPMRMTSSSEYLLQIQVSSMRIFIFFFCKFCFVYFTIQLFLFAVILNLQN